MRRRKAPTASGIWQPTGGQEGLAFPAVNGDEVAARVNTAYAAIIVRALADVAGGRFAALKDDGGILFSFCTLFVGVDPMNSMHSDRDATDFGLLCPVFSSGKFLK